MGAICPCLGREKGELIPSDASGGADGYGWCVAKNQRQHMEDAVDVDVRGPGQSRLFAVYDGHGGAEAVAYVKEELPKIVNTTGEGEEEVAKFHRSYEKLDQGLLEHLNSTVEKSPTRTLTSGVVACIALCQGQRVLIANLGDCRALQSKKGKIEALTRDHCPTETEETMRLAQLGLQAEDGYLCEGLSVSRAFGDFDLTTGEKCSGLICQPDVSIVEVDEDTEFILLASDGLFERMDWKEVGSSTRRFLRRAQNAKTACEQIVQQAIKLGSTDNIGAVLITFKMPAPENGNSALRRKVVLDGL